MFSGKTSELLRRIRRFTLAKRTCLVIKYNKDKRYSEDQMSTHDKQMWVAKSAGILSEIEESALDVDVIGIDEGQFFPDLAEFAEDWSNRGKIIIVAALDGTFQRKPFGNVLNLVPLAEEVTKLSAVCMMCYRAASFSKRIGSEMEVELIGGSDKYVAVCRYCYHQNSDPRSKPAQTTPKRQRVCQISSSGPSSPLIISDHLTTYDHDN